MSARSTWSDGRKLDVHALSELSNHADVGAARFDLPVYCVHANTNVAAVLLTYILQDFLFYGAPQSYLCKHWICYDISICLSVRLSVTLRYCVNMKERRGMRFSPSGSPVSLHCVSKNTPDIFSCNLNTYFPISIFLAQVLLRV